MESVSAILMGLIALLSFASAVWYKRKARDEKYTRIQAEYEDGKEEAIEAIKNTRMDNLVRDSNERLRERRKRRSGGS